jgi:C-terminal processing protease CtpA/Prc
VLTSDGTASASELIINGLRPFMDVVLIGDTTYGKNVGSFTIYDSPDFSDENINPNHKSAIQPISFQVFNKNDESNYANGFAPNIEVLEYQYAASGLKAFGDVEEPLLNAALNQISGTIARSSLSENKKLDTKKVSNNSSSDMYVLPNEKGLIK